MTKGLATLRHLGLCRASWGRGMGEPCHAASHTLASARLKPPCTASCFTLLPSAPSSAKATDSMNASAVMKVGRMCLMMTREGSAVPVSMFIGD